MLNNDIRRQAASALEPIPSLLAHYCKVLVQIARDKNVDLNSLHNELGLDLSVSEQQLSNYTFTPEHHAILVAKLTEVLDDEFLGSTSYRCKPGTYKLIFEIISACETLGDAIDKCFKLYAAITDDIALSLREDGIMAVVELQLSGPQIDRYCYTRESIMRGFHRLFSALISDNIPLHEVTFVHQSNVPSIEYTRVFHCPCAFGQAAQTMRFDKRLLKSRVRIDPNSWHIIWQTSQHRMDCVSLPAAGSVSELIKKEATAVFLTTQQFPTLDQMAINHHKSVQTLRRLLKAHNENYSDIKEQIRKAVVLKWLDNPSMSLSEVAEIGGFAEANGLSRAFKQWFGISPSEYRKKQNR